MRNIQTGIHYPLPIEKLPDSWEVDYVGHFANEIQPGFASGEHNKEGEGIPHLRPMNIDRNGKLDLNVIKYVSPDKDKKRLKAGDVFFNNTNSPELVGKTTVITKDTDLGFSNHMTRIRFPDEISPKFVSYQLHFLWMSGYFLHKCLKHVNQASVSSKALADSVPLILAPPNEQRRIVAEIEKQFSRLDEATSALKRIKANLNRYKASVLKAAVEGKLTEEWRKEHPDVEPTSELLKRILTERRKKWEEEYIKKYREAHGHVPKDDSWKKKYKEPVSPDIANLPKLPKGWVWVRSEQLGEIIGGLTQNRKREQYLKKLPYLRVANVYANELRLDDVNDIGVLNEEMDRALLQKDDLLIVEGNGSKDQIGRLAIWDGSIAPCVHQNHLIKIRLIQPVIGKFILWWLLSLYGRKHVMDVASSTSGLYTLSISKVSDLPIPLPPLKEQRLILEEVDSRFSVANVIETEIKLNLKRAERLCQSILKKAFSGQLVPQDLNDEPASELLEKINVPKEKLVDSDKPYKQNKT